MFARKFAEMILEHCYTSKARLRMFPIIGGAEQRKASPICDRQSFQ